MMSENMGGGYQYPKAVLDAIGKRYVVETGHTENGWFTRYSDGWIEQGGKLTNTDGTTAISFEIEMSDVNYYFQVSYKASTGGESYSRAPREIGGTRTTTGLTVYQNGSVHQGSSGSWEAKGFAA